MSYARRIVAVLCLGISAFFISAAGLSQALNSVIGTPERAVTNTLAVITTPSASHALADAFVTQLGKDASGPDAVAIMSHKTELIDAVATEIRNPVTQALARQIALTYFDAQKSGTAKVIDLRPLFFRFTEAMHRVDPQLPAQPTDLSSTTITVNPDNQAITTIDSLGSSMWFNLLVGLGLALVIARFAIRNAFRRKLALALTLGIPSFILIAFGARLGSTVEAIKMDDANLHVVLTKLADRIGSALLQAGLYALLTGTVVVVAWIGYERWSAAKTPTVVHSELPTPLSTQVSETPEPLAQTASDPGVAEEK